MRVKHKNFSLFLGFFTSIFIPSIIKKTNENTFCIECHLFYDYKIHSYVRKITEKTIYEVLESFNAHRKFYFKENPIRGGDSLGIEKFFRKIKTYENNKVVHIRTSLLSSEADKDIYQPISHDYEDFPLQLTYYGLGRGSTNSLKDLVVQGETGLSFYAVISFE